MVKSPTVGPRLTPLESRVNPTFNIFYAGTTLNVVGFTDFENVMPGDGLNLTVVGTNSVRVEQVSGGLTQVNYGIYRVQNNLNVKLARYDTDINLDLNGGRIPGNVNFSLGLGDIDSATLQDFVNIIDGEIGGSLSIQGGSGLETINLGDLLSGGGLDVSGNVIVRGNLIANPNDTFGVGDLVNINDGTLLRRDLITNEVDSINVGDPVTLTGVVNGNVVLNVQQAQGNVGQMDVFSQVGGNITFVGNDNTDFMGNGDRLTLTEGSIVNGIIATAFRGGTTSELEIRSTSTVFGSISHSAFSGDDTVLINGEVFGSVSSYLGQGDNLFELGSGAASAYVGGDITITALNGANVVDMTAVAVNSTIDGDVFISLGNGSNEIDINDFIAINGDLVQINVGSGADTVTLDGLRTFRFQVYLGAGLDELTITDGVGSATIDFGLDFDQDVWNPPPVITFPLNMLRVP